MSYQIYVTYPVYCRLTDAALGSRTSPVEGRHYLNPLLALKMAERLNDEEYESGGGEAVYCAAPTKSRSEGHLMSNFDRVEPEVARGLGHEFGSYGTAPPRPRTALLAEIRRRGWNLLARRRALHAYDYDVQFWGKILP